MAAPVGEIKDRLDREITDLRSKAESVRERVRSVESAGATNWGRMKYAVEEGLKDLGKAIDQAVDTLRKTGSGGH